MLSDFSTISVHIPQIDVCTGIINSNIKAIGLIIRSKNIIPSTDLFENIEATIIILMISKSLIADNLSENFTFS